MRPQQAWVTLVMVPGMLPVKRSLTLNRTPKYLRFVVVGEDWSTLDALDQLTDEPKPNERLIAAVKDDAEGSMHLDRRVNGRRVGEWYRTVNYVAVPEQPPQEVLRDTARWQEWCYSQPGAPKPSEAAK